MNNATRSSDQPSPGLSIGDLAARTGVGVATLRMWEQRHGFPEPHRLPSGHRRYRDEDVDAVLRVVRRRDGGTRLDVAIRAETRATDERPGRGRRPSIYAELQRRHPALPVHRLRKPTLLALSWAIEDEFCAQASGAHLFGAFQHDSYFRAAEARWTDLARLAGSCHVFADFDGRAHPSGPTRVHLDDDAPLRREWAVVCDSPDLPAVLTAWALPGQEDVPERDRVFEAMWTVDRRAVRDAARVCAGIAAESGADGAGAVVEDLDHEPHGTDPDGAAVLAMLNRVVAYLDRLVAS